MNIAPFIRLACVLAFIALFTVDFIFAAAAREIPEWAYYLLLGGAIGIDAEWLRRLLQHAIATRMGVDLDKEKEKGE